ncbi:hypothetical protein [Shewanella sp. ANA-3]|uniref:hypothetical protein n=1 Tax=Shewanella sp. (strain ANA-3) TaxID=94122 RepID=UPI00059EA166|nr:hypothetical protein [Shewanella sp. ANA-3]
MSLNEVESQLHILIGGLEQARETLLSNHLRLREIIEQALATIEADGQVVEELKSFAEDLDDVANDGLQRRVPDLVASLERRQAILRSYLYDY